MEEVPTTICPECSCSFQLTWNPDPVYDKPEYCPMCGERIDYKKQTPRPEGG